MDLLLIIIIVLPLVANLYIKSAYNKYRKISNLKEMTGFDVARRILDSNGLNEVLILETNGELSDHYNPRRKVVKLSRDIYHGETIAAMSVAAHECGHAIQDKEGYSWMKIRSAMCPVVNFITYSAYILIVISCLLQAFDMILLAFVMYFAGLLFQLVTLPVEFNASERAMKHLDDLGLATSDSRDSIKKVLTAAAYTYVAAVISSLLEILRILIALNDRRD